MFVVNTDTTINPLSSFIWNQVSFINRDRLVTDTCVTSSIDGSDIKFLNFSDKTTNLSIYDNYYCFLTNACSISSIFSTLTSVNTKDYGLSASQDSVKYSTTNNEFSSVYHNNNIINMLGVVTSGVEVNIIPLKNRYSVNGISYRNDVNHKNYQKIYINDNNFLQFKISDIPITLQSDVTTDIIRSHGISSTTITNMNFAEFGAIGGNCPANSDNILFNTSEYSLSCNDYSDRFDFNNGTMLCAWLSSQTYEPSSSKIWMERWYDPNTVTQGDAFIVSDNALLSSLSYIVDIPSSKIIHENEKMSYVHYGPICNENFINSLNNNLIMYLSAWDRNISSSVGGISGVLLGNFDGTETELNLDGNTHVHIPPVDSLVVENGLTVSLWVYSDNWDTCNDTQFFGNFYNGNGYSLGYNTGKHNSLITVPTLSGNCVSINTRGFKVFDKNIIADLGLSASSITYIKNDIFDNKWLYDNHNKSIYKLENDDIVNYIVDLPVSSNIVKMECNSRNELFVLDSVSNNISSFDSTGILLSSGAMPSYYDNFEIDLSDSIVYDNADFLIIDNNNNVIKLIGSTLYNNDNRILHLTDKPSSIKVDIDNYIWILLEDRIIKTDNTGNILFIKHLDITLTDYSAEMGFVSMLKNGRSVVQLWIIYNTSKKLLILDLLGNIIKRIDINNMLTSNNCRSFDLNIKGDFTGFDNKRKFQQLNEYPISPTNPSICLKLGLKCGSTARYVELNTSITDISGWTHLAFNIINDQDITEINLFVNGILKQSETLVGNYSISYDSDTSPFIIGGVSGKLGAKNLEKSVTTGEFFMGKVDDIRIYSMSLDNFAISRLSRHNHFIEWSDMNYFVEVSPITLIEEMEQLHINRYKGFKSNLFNIRIKNFTDNTDLRNIIIQYINNMINKIKPVNTVLNNIEFE